DTSPALHVIGLNRQQFLQRIGSTIGLERPDLHLAEALAAILRFTAKRLLSDERIWAYRPRMNLVRHKVAELHHVDVANYDFLVERIAGATIEQTRLSVLLHPCEALLLFGLLQIVANLFFLDSIEDRGGHFESKCFRSNAEVGFQNLTHIHTAPTASRVKHDVNRCSVREERHVFLGYNARHNAFVAVTACHFVANTELALASDVNFDLFDYPRFDLLAAFHAVRRPIPFELQLGELVFVSANDFPDPVPNWAGIDLDMIVGSRQFSQKRFRDFSIGRDND